VDAVVISSRAVNSRVTGVHPAPAHRGAAPYAAMLQDKVNRNSVGRRSAGLKSAYISHVHGPLETMQDAPVHARLGAASRGRAVRAEVADSAARTRKAIPAVKDVPAIPMPAGDRQ
jgi:hypothetical protein